MDIETKCVNAIRVLSADAIQKAKSGHPGMPLGAAPTAYELWAHHMNHNPKNPAWVNRDRFVLSSGHASAMLYSLLHFFGYGLTLDDIKNFRQEDSLTPGHPEYGRTIGVEATTGPLGSGLGMAVGMAMAEAHLAAKFNKPDFPIVDHYTFALCGDDAAHEGRRPVRRVDGVKAAAVRHRDQIARVVRGHHRGEFTGSRERIYRAGQDHRREHDRRKDRGHAPLLRDEQSEKARGQRDRHDRKARSVERHEKPPVPR